jgi:hypothetical protein
MTRAFRPAPASADAPAAHAPPDEGSFTLRARGVRYFPGRVRCPFAGLGHRGAYHSNRLAVDDEHTVASLDAPRRRIVFENARRYERKAVLGDVLFLVDGVTRSGRRTPLGLHLKVLKQGARFSLDLHRHLRTAEPIVSADFEPFEVVLTSGDGDREQVVLTPESALATLRKLPLAMRIIKAFMVTRDNLAGVVDDPGRPGFRIADLSMGFGLLGIDSLLVRAELVALAPVPRCDGAGLAEILMAGAWEFKLTALSDKWLTPVVQRDLFLFGLEDLPVLRPVRERGLLRGETLAFRFEQGRGAVSHGPHTHAFADAPDVARAYLECHLLGGLLAVHAEQRLGLAVTP